MSKVTDEFIRTVVDSYHDVLLLEETKRKYSRITTSFRGRNAMEWLYKQGSRKCSELAAYLKISRPSATALIKKLEELGYVKRQTAGDDGRSGLLSLTRKGQLVTAYQSSHRNEMLERSIAEFSEEELAMIMRGFKKMNEIFEGCCRTLEEANKGERK